MYDFIGDIHGHADRLKILLLTIGYKQEDGVFRHPNRKVIFVGDYIDRGPQIPETLRIVKSMVDDGQATALMGNHEYNALCFHYMNQNGGHLREHSIKNILQHIETLRQFQNRQQEYDEYIRWFFSLPLFFETDQFRAVHASWDNAHIETLQSRLINGRLEEGTLRESADKGSDLYKAVDVTLKGKEIKLPPGRFFKDKDGNVRTEIRTRWWLNPTEHTYSTYSIVALKGLDDLRVEVDDPNHYGRDQRPVFFGHYWLNGQPSLFRSNICCLDFSVAKDGVLTAYSWDGESELENVKFTAV